MSIHRPETRRELGYATERCAECGTFWPCGPARIQIEHRNGTFDPSEWVEEDIEEAAR